MADIAELGFSIQSAPIEKAESSLDKLSNAAKRTETATEKMNREADNASKRMQAMSGSSRTLTATLTRMAGVITAALSVRQIQQYADTWSDLSSRVRLAIGPGQNAADVMSRLSDIARMTYSSLESTAESFTRNAMTLTALGKTTQQQLDFTEALNNALVVSGAKGMAFESAQVAIGKAMAEGTLRGDELNNILNNGGRIAQLLAEDLGTNVTQLRKLAADGKITGDVIYNSLIKNMETLREEAASMPATIGDAFTLIRNAILESVGVLDQNNKLSETLAENLVKVADAIRNTDWSPYVNALTLAAKLYAAYLVTARAVPAAVALGSAAHKAYTVVLWAFTAQAAAANAQMTLMQRTLLGFKGAVGVASAAFVGWSIGTYLREEFEIVEKAGIALMSGLHQAAIAIGGVFKGIGETIKFALTSPLSFVWGRIVSFLEMIQGLGASAAKALGFEGLAEVIGQDLTHLRATTDQEYRATIQGIVDTTKAEMAGVSDVYFELFDSVGKKAKEAGSVIEESAKNTGGTVTNTITEEMSKADKAYAKFRANLELTIQSTNLMSAAYLTSAEAVEEVTIQQEIESEVLKQGAKHREEITRLIREQHAANKALDLSKTIADMRAQNAELKAYEAALIAGGDATEAGRQALEAYNDQREIEATLVGKTSKEIDKLLPKLREEQKIRRDQRARNKEVEELNGLVKDTRTAQEKANAELERLEKLAKNAKTPEHLEAIRRKVAEVKSSMSEWGQFTQRALDSVDDAFANAWKNIDQGFSSFADGLKNAFKNLLAELAHMAITRPIIMQFASMLGIGGGTQGNNGIWGGLLGGGPSSGGGGIGGALQGANQIRSIGSIWSGAQALWPALQGGWANGGFSGATGSLGSSIGSMLGIGSGTAGSLAAGSQISGYTGAAMSKWVAAQTANTAATSTLSSTLSGLTGMLSNPITWIGAGLAASWKLYGAGYRGDGGEMRQTWSNTSGLAGELGNSVSFLSSVYERHDKIVGSVIGDKLANVLSGGPVVQALGMAIHRLFGSGEKYKRTVGSAQGVYSAGEYTGMGAVESWFNGSRRFGDDFDKSLHDLNEAFSTSLGGLFEMFDIDSDIMTTAKTRLRRTSGRLVGDFTATFDDAVVTLNRQYGGKGNVQKGLEQYFDRVMGEGLSMAIGKSRLPEYLKELTEGLTKAAEVSEAVGGLFARFEGVNNTIEALNFSAFELTDAGLRGADALLDLSAAIAGLEDPTTADKIASLTALTSTYYDQFFTDAEKTENTINSITRAFEEADVTLAGSRAEYRAMVEDIDLTTAAGREMFATLMALSGQAATYYSIVEQQAAQAAQAAAAAAAAQALSDAVGSAFGKLHESVAAERRALDDEYNAKLDVINAARDAVGSAIGKMQESVAAERRALDDEYNAKLGVINAARDAVGSAIGRLRTAVEAEQDRLRTEQEAALDRVSELAGLSDSLRSGLRSMRLESEQFDRMRRDQAKGQISSALALARSGGSLQGLDLSDALRELSSSDTSGFASFEEYARDYWRTANDINELAGLTDAQLSLDEQIAKSLEEQSASLGGMLAAAQSQYDALMGIDSSVLSVGDAVALFESSLVTAQQTASDAEIERLTQQHDESTAYFDQMLADAQRQMDILQGIDSSVLSVGRALANFQKAASVATSTPKTNSQSVASAYVEVLGRTADADGLQFWTDKLARGELTQAQLKQQLAQGALNFDSGSYSGAVSLADIEASKKAAAKYLGVPGFASGGFHSGGLRLVGENGPELEVTGPSRIYNVGQTAAMLGGGADVAEAIMRLQQAIERQGDALRSIAKHAMQTARRVEFLERWDGDGLPPERDFA